ncbi:hypothetical protein ROZALSC1DRAFT_26105 [Rozella allomycis CSF55]|uniref:Uncharacterized protein n=1 Tax=Rozella allomycis (strain CSF55) TaxID=988480 RepID=A0A4P9YB11_ROZAC|nr:hypothetical protein ROZALSC1DRAFT_26105 [Rozella allomycis CSF55]
MATLETAVFNDEVSLRIQYENLRNAMKIPFKFEVYLSNSLFIFPSVSATLVIQKIGVFGGAAGEDIILSTVVADRGLGCIEITSSTFDKPEKIKTGTHNCPNQRTNRCAGVAYVCAVNSENWCRRGHHPVYRRRTADNTGNTKLSFKARRTT